MRPRRKVFGQKIQATSVQIDSYTTSGPAWFFLRTVAKQGEIRSRKYFCPTLCESACCLINVYVYTSWKFHTSALMSEKALEFHGRAV